MKITSSLLRRSAKSWFSWDLEVVGPSWLQWVWTLLFAAVIALGFTVLGMGVNASRDPSRWLDLSLWGRWYRVNFAISLTISVLIHLLFAVAIPAVGKARLKRMSNGQRTVFFIGIPMTGVLVGWPLGVWFVGQDVAHWINIDHPGQVLGSAIVTVGISMLFFLFFNTKAKQMLAEKRATEAQLRLLQGQIEPHFLFNTLANVQSLIDHEPVKARQMLEAFTDYLRSSLGGLRRDQSTLGDELELARSYLELIQARMGERLRYRIDVDPALRALPMAPLLVQPLIENAIHHGLEPKVEGGELRIDARRDGSHVVVSVVDDGLGLNAPSRRSHQPGLGMALENIRQRLDAAHGSDAGLELTAQNPGTMATLRLPIEHSLP